MANLIPVTDVADPRLDDYLRLREATLRRSIESERGLFIAEGAKVIQRALEAGYQPRSLLLTPRWLQDLSALVEPLATKVFLADEDLIEKVTGFHVHRGALGSFHRHDRFKVADLLTASRLMVLQDLVDHTNVGSIIRNAAALGWDGVLVSAGCADPLYRRSIKVSMGTVFSLPWARLPAKAPVGELLSQAGFTVVALALRPQAVELKDFLANFDPTARLAVLLGSEGPGLSGDWIAAAHQVVRIPMRAGVDSLNVAAASAVIGWALGP